MFVYLNQPNEIAARHPKISKARMIVSQEKAHDVMTLNCGLTPAATNHDITISESMQAACKVSDWVGIVASGSLPNDGKVIDDIRTYE